MMTFRYITFLFILAALSACDLDKTAKMKQNLPKASGKPGHIIVVIDSAQWKGAVGKKIRETFQSNVEYLPRQEPMFSLSQVGPLKFQSILKMQKNILIVTILGDHSKANRRLKTFFTKESLKLVAEDSSRFMFTKKDEFARGQEIVHLFSESPEILIHNIEANKSKLRQYFLDLEAKEIYHGLYDVKYEKGISNHIREKFGCDLKVPLGYDIAMEDDKFVWLRDFTPDIDKSVFISWVDYTSESLFSQDSLLNLRTELSKPYIRYKPTDPDSYMLTETEHFDVFRKELNYNGHYAVQINGLWKTNKYYMGGPFVGLAMVDNSSNRLYYIEGFLYSPGKEQRDLMRELETAIKTFKVPQKKK